MPLSVIITGASAGLGAALARAYADRGATLALIARRQEMLLELAHGLPTEAVTYSADVRDSAAMRAAAADFLVRYGAPDVVIANAGVSVGTLTEKAEDTDVFARVLETNVVGAVNTFQPFVAAMQAQRRGVLVGIASVAGYRGLPGAAAYSASKSALITYLESLRVELRASEVSVITVCPGYIATTMTERNPYRMPFMMQPDVAAAKIMGLVERRTSYAVIPWQMAVVARVLRLLPNVVFDRLFERAPRKPRTTAT